MACDRASSPVLSVSSSGMERVREGCKTACSGYSRGWDTEYFSPFSPHRVPQGVTSEPVPAVVGIAMIGSVSRSSGKFVD